MSYANLRTEWFGNIRGDLLAGLVVALALIPKPSPFPSSPGLTPKWASTHPSVSPWSSPLWAADRA